MTLKTAVMLYGPNIGFESKDVSACSLLASVDMALFCAGVDSDIIKMVGR